MYEGTGITEEMFNILVEISNESIIAQKDRCILIYRYGVYEGPNRLGYMCEMQEGSYGNLEIPNQHNYNDDLDFYFIKAI